MSENKTRPTDASVPAFVDGVGNSTRRRDAHALLAMLRRVTGEEPRMWGPSIVGYGSMHYRYESGREGDMPRIGFSPRKASLVLYVLTGAPGEAELLARLGKHRTGVACLYVNKLADVDVAVLERLAADAWARTGGVRAADTSRSITEQPHPPMTEHRIYTTRVASVYPHYVAKVERKGRERREVDEAICWLTGYTPAQLAEHLEAGTDFRTFFAEAPRMHPNADKITGTICGVRIAEIEDPLMRQIRWLDKLVDEIARGRPMAKVLRG